MVQSGVEGLCSEADKAAASDGRGLETILYEAIVDSSTTEEALGTSKDCTRILAWLVSTREARAQC